VSSRNADCKAFPVSMSLRTVAWRAVNVTCNSSPSSRGLHQRGYCRKRRPAHCVNFPGVRPVTLFQQDAKPEECRKLSALCIYIYMFGLNRRGLRRYSRAFRILQRHCSVPHCRAFHDACMHKLIVSYFLSVISFIPTLCTLLHTLKTLIYINT
jgi:hypothetical protein